MAIEIFLETDDQLVTAHPGSTICELIVIQLQRIYYDQCHGAHEEEFVRLANILLPHTKTYGVYVVAIYQALEELNYGLALQAGKLMLQHETMLHRMISGDPVKTGAMIN